MWDFSAAEADALQTRLSMMWLSTWNRPVGVHWVGKGGNSTLYSQDAGPCGPPEGSIVHLLQVYIFF